MLALVESSIQRPFRRQADRSLAPRNASKQLHPSNPMPLSPALLGKLVEELAAAVITSGVNVSLSEGREFRRLFQDAQCEAWLIAWAPSTFLGLHDHGGSNGAFSVLTGALDESQTDTRTRHRLQTARIAQGSSRAFGATHVHEVWNPDPTPAVSIHVYSPPLTRMNFFRDGATDFLALERTELVDGCPEATLG